MEVFILSGIPTSGKSTFVKKFVKSREKFFEVKVVSRDQIRLDLFGKNYKQNRKDEEIVTMKFDALLVKYLKEGGANTILIDNTNLRLKYIKEIYNMCSLYTDVIYFVPFDVSLFTAFFRNIKRFILTGKYIPFKVIKEMKKSKVSSVQMHRELTKLQIIVTNPEFLLG